MSLRGIWKIQTESIIVVRFRDSDAGYWKPVVVDKLLAGWEKLKKENHGQVCYDQRRIFSPFVLSVDGMMGKAKLVYSSI